MTVEMGTLIRKLKLQFVTIEKYCLLSRGPEVKERQVGSPES